ncbi:MAG: dCTP deaminase [Aigarchaeota archaeon]|nr:dCTP deaminase [Aigarchaeota archaeon]MCS7126866.1 dCTP deaminase [Candidatus Calditenuaceae archaeon]MCX8203272.1 dCTP deaminase [Nitrososphaeria archaeon]
MILSDFDLWNYIKSGRLRVDPISEDTVRENGLDLRIGEEIARLRPVEEVLDTMDGDVNRFYQIERGSSFVIRPREHVLLHTVEFVSMPKDLMGFVNLRSTFARLGLSIPPTIIDADFEGQLTIEMVGGEFPVRLHAGQRFLHVVFAKLTSEVSSPYRGKYQGQRGVRLPELRERAKA